ncbi:MAG: conjugal transfer protein TraR [Melioribacteraceae bacterium]|jgi:RNA polymerase-binding transcription factor DksA|nr:MAG: conjugal transfer protein TraR [Melioribacteraceae bacterium]
MGMAKKTVKKSTAAAKTTTKKKAAPKKNTKTAAKSKTTVKKTVAKKAAPKKTKAKSEKTTKKKITQQEVEIVSPSKKIRKVKGYPKKDLEDFKEIILQKRNEIIEQLQSLKDQMMDPTTGQYVNESSPYSLHMAEQGTDAMEREKLYLWAQRENKFLTYLEEALQRIENGTYGICIDCIDEPQNLCPTCPLIPKERLKAVPHTQHCLQVKQKMQGK